MYQKKFQKVAIVGVGNVGSAIAYGLVNQSLCNEVILINRNKEKAMGIALDMRQSMVYMQRNMHVWEGDCSDCGDADIVFITLGGHVTTDRNDALASSCEMVKPYVEQIMAAGFEGHFIVVTNPVDVVSYYIWKISGLPTSHVIGTGTALDTARLKCFVSELTGIAQRNVVAMAMGEHGSTVMIPWSLSDKKMRDILAKEYDPEHSTMTEKDKAYGSIEAHILDKVKKAGFKINDLVGYTCYGVAASALAIARSILRDENTPIICSVYLSGQYGASDVFASVPVVLNADGAVDIIELPITEDELQQFQASAQAIRKGIDAVLKEKFKL